MNKLRELFEKDTPIDSYQVDPIHLTEEGKALIYGDQQDIPDVSFSLPVQRRKHRKKRINKKWLKKYGYRNIYVAGRFERVGDTEFAFNGRVVDVLG